MKTKIKSRAVTSLSVRNHCL